MKQRKKFTKFFMIVIALLLTVAAFLPVKVYSAGSRADVSMEVQAGFNGVARLGAYIPYRILLINKGRAVEGEAQIEIKIDSQNKTVFSKPVSLAERATKEIVINAPVFTARRGIQVKFREAGKTVKEMEYTFTKLIPPEMKTIGVLSSDNAAYDFMNGAMIPQSGNNAYDEKMNVMKAAGVYSSSVSVTAEARKAGEVNKVESILIPLTGENFPEDIKIMNSFDILILGNFDTGTLSVGQLKALEKWVESGGTLVIGTGANWKKVYSSIPDTLKKFSISGISSGKPSEELGNFAETDFTSSADLDTVTGNIGFEYVKAETERPEKTNTVAEGDKELFPVYSANVDEVLIGDGVRPLAVKYMHQSGRILFLTFDPGMEPFVNWEGRQTFWENLLFHSSNASRIYQRGSGYYYANNNYYLNDLAAQVPEDRSPPFLFMFIMIAAYIIIAGPVIYIFLKKKDKRDFNWLAVPAIALVCLLIIYVAGFKTRYSTAVFNTVSMINLDMDNQKADITTGMGVFNNKRGDLKLTYSEQDHIDFDVTQSENQSYVVYADGKEPEGKVVSKLVSAEPASYELYDVSMWEPKYLTAKKSEPFQDKIINSVQISDGIFHAVINNTTKYDFTEAFITIGSNFINAGDILSGREKVLEVDLKDKNVCNSFEEYLEVRYGRSSYPSNVTPPADFREKRRKRLEIERLLQPQYAGIRGQTKIGLYALNNQNLGYNIRINDERPVSYFTNGIFSSMEMNFEKGREVDLPSGIILPAIEEYGLEQNIASFDSDTGVNIRDKGDIDFTYRIPEGIRPTEFTLGFDTYIPLYVKYNMEEMKSRNSNFKSEILQNRYEFYLYNKASDSWEQIKDTHIQTEGADRYVDKENRLKVRVKVIEVADANMKSLDGYVESERLAFPALQLKGVVR